MTADLAATSEAERASMIRAFDARYGEMERVLWCLSRHCRTPLLAGRASPVVEEFAWTVKSWWGVVGVDATARSPFAEALAGLAWSPELLDDRGDVRLPSADTYAYELVNDLVERSCSLGLQRLEYSWASKVLHWLLPWTVPAYDSYVRRALRIPGWGGPRAYRRVARDVFVLARRVVGPDTAWMGSLDPRSPLRALDKWLWWVGGGSAGTARLEPHPWRVVERLGIAPDAT